MENRREVFARRLLSEWLRKREQMYHGWGVHCLNGFWTSLTPLLPILSSCQLQLLCQQAPDLFPSGLVTGLLAPHHLLLLILFWLGFPGLVSCSRPFFSTITWRFSGRLSQVFYKVEITYQILNLKRRENFLCPATGRHTPMITVYIPIIFKQHKPWIIKSWLVEQQVLDLPVRTISVPLYNGDPGWKTVNIPTIHKWKHKGNIFWYKNKYIQHNV